MPLSQDPTVASADYSVRARTAADLEFRLDAGRDTRQSIAARHRPRMDLHPSVAERLAKLAPDQRAAATSPPGPSLCIAPAGSGKTTTLVASAAWLIATGTPPEAIRAITFNKRAALEMTERLDAALDAARHPTGAVRVRTFHALGREILRDAGVTADRWSTGRHPS